MLSSFQSRKLKVDYAIPCTHYNKHDHVKFRVGTNDIPQEKVADNTAQSVMNWTENTLHLLYEATVSSIILWNDKCNIKIAKVNGYLNLLNESVNIPFIGCRIKPLLD